MSDKWPDALKSIALSVLATGIVSAARPANAESCMDQTIPADDAEQALVNQSRQLLGTGFGVSDDALGQPVRISAVSSGMLSNAVTFPVTEAAAKTIQDLVMLDGARTDDEPLIRYFRTCTGQIGDELTGYGVTIYLPEDQQPQIQSKAIPAKTPRPKGP